MGALGRLNPANNQIRTYTIPAPSEPQPEPIMVASNNGQIWYTNLSGSVGRLDPAAASGTTSTVSPSSAPVTPVCASAGSGTAIDVSQRSGTLTWGAADYPLVQDQDGWTIYGLPQGAAPWGLAANSNNVWFNDQGSPGQRPQMLGWMEFAEEPTLTATPTDTPTITLTPTSTSTGTPGPSPTATDGPSPTPMATSRPPQDSDYWVMMPVVFKE